MELESDNEWINYLKLFLIALLLGRFEAQPTKKNYDHGRTRTCNPQIRSLMPYPLGHAAIDVIVY